MHAAGRSAPPALSADRVHDCYYYMNMSSDGSSVKMGQAAKRLTRKLPGLLPEQRGRRFDGALAAHGQSAAPTWRSRGREDHPREAAVGTRTRCPIHRGLDKWTGLGLIATGMERRGFRLHLTNAESRIWRATFSSHPMTK